MNYSTGLEMLNDKALVNTLVSGIERNKEITDAGNSGRDVSYNPILYASLCRLCHHLLVLHPLALHKFRLLYTLAFRSSFLHLSTHLHIKYQSVILPKLSK